MAGKKALDAKQGGTVWLLDPRDLTRVTDPKHVLYDPTVHDKPPGWLVAAIRKKYDRTQAILVRKNGQKDGRDVLEIVDGRSKHAAALIVADEMEEAAGPDARLRVPVIIAAAKEEVEYAEIMLRTRYLKKKIDVITMADQVFDYMDKFGRSEEEAASIFKLTTKTISNYRVLVQLASEVKQAVRDRRIAAHDAIETFGKMSTDEQRRALAAVLKSAPGRSKGDEDEDMPGDDDTGAGGGSNGHRSGKKRGEKKQKKISAIKRIRLIFRSEKAMQALSRREEIFVRWVFDNATLPELREVHPALADAIEAARKSTPAPAVQKHAGKKHGAAHA